MTKVVTAKPYKGPDYLLELPLVMVLSILNGITYIINNHNIIFSCGGSF